MSPPGTGMGTTPLPSVALNQEALSSHHSWCNHASALLLLVCYVPLRPRADHPDQLNSEPFPQHLNARCLCSTDKWNYFNSHSDFFFFLYLITNRSRSYPREHTSNGFVPIHTFKHTTEHTPASHCSLLALSYLQPRAAGWRQQSYLSLQRITCHYKELMACCGCVPRMTTSWSTL